MKYLIFFSQLPEVVHEESCWWLNILVFSWKINFTKFFFYFWNKRCRCLIYQLLCVCQKKGSISCSREHKEEFWDTLCTAFLIFCSAMHSQNRAGVSETHAFSPQTDFSHSLNLYPTFFRYIDSRQIKVILW